MKSLFFTLTGMLTAAATLFANMTPVARPADMQTLRLTKSGTGIQLVWTDGVSTFSFARDNQVSFGDAPSLILQPGISPPNYFDAGSLSENLTHFYNITDSQITPAIFTITPQNPASGDTVTISGMGLTGVTVTDAAGNPVTLASSSDTSISFQVSTTSALTSGPFVLSGTNGSAITDPIPVTLHKIGVIGLGTPGHVTYDSVNSRVLYANFENTTAKLFKYTPATGVSASFGALIPKFVVGLAIGPYNGAGRFLYVTSNTKSLGTNNNGNIFAYDLVTEVKNTVGPQTTDSVNDSVDTRALAIGPDPYGTAGYAVHSLTLPSLTLGSMVRFLNVNKTLPPATAWLPVSSTGDVTNQNFPGGLAVTSSRGYYFTNGGNPGSIAYWKPTSGTPIGHRLEFTSSAAQFITNPAGLALDIPTTGVSRPRSIWVANRGAVGTGSIVRLNVTPGGLDTARANPRGIELYKGIINDPRGVAPQYAQAKVNGEYTKFLWVTTAGGLQVYRALRSVKLKFFISSFAKNSFANLPATTDGEIQAWLSKSFDYARRLYQTVGIQLEWDGTFTMLTNSCGAACTDNSFSYYAPSSTTACGPELAADSSLMDDYSINVFVVHGIRGDGTETSAIVDAIGFTRLNTTIACGASNKSFILMSYGDATSPLNTRPTLHDLAHEIGHQLLYYNGSLGQFDGLGHSSSVTHIMYFQDTPSASAWTNADDILINDPANQNNFLILPEGGAP